MRKFALTILAGSILVCFLSLPALHAGDEAAPAEVICMSAPEGYAPVKKDGTPGKLQKKVPFAHDKHAAIDCAACHHQPADGKTYASCNSAGCHENMDSKTGADSFYAAFHAANSDKSCLGCHKGLQKDKKPTGPTACGKCHTDC